MQPVDSIQEPGLAHAVSLRETTEQMLKLGQMFPATSCEHWLVGEEFKLESG